VKTMSHTQQHDSTGGDSYDALSIMFHWITAFLVVAIFALVLAPGIVRGSIALHNTLGLLLLIIVPLRAVWRFAMGGALHRSTEARFSRLAATLTHGSLYVLLVGIPVLGLFYVDAKGIDFKPFGIHLPQIVNYDRELAQAIYAWKKWIAYVMLALILFHAAAAIVYHHFFRKDRVLRSMVLVGRSPEEALDDADRVSPGRERGAGSPAVFRKRGYTASAS
jgi:superoxide oxidase